MDITYFGHSCFKLKTKELTLVIDPFDPAMTGLKLSKLSADVVLITHAHHDHDHRNVVSDYRLVIDGPGEYELSGVNIFGIPTYHDDEGGRQRGGNTMYYIEAGGVSVLHCGDLGHTLDDATLDKFGEVTVLLIPVGGFYTIDAKNAAAVIASIEPAFVVPMHYRMDGSKIDHLDTVEKFLDEMGIENGNAKKAAVLKVSSADNNAETSVVVLEKQ